MQLFPTNIKIILSPLLAAAMGDVTFKLNKTSETGGVVDDEDNWNEMSGSGDGEENVTSFSTKPPGKWCSSVTVDVMDFSAQMLYPVN